MKNEFRLAILCLAVTSISAMAQNAVPQCGPANFDQSRNVFTAVNPSGDSVNQQCILTVLPKGTVTEQSRQYPAFYPTEGSYVIELSGGGGGGGGGASKDQGGGGGGAGAAPSRTIQYLAPGAYKLTIGTGGEGGSANGGRTGAGNPTSLTNATTGQLIAGFPGADVWSQRSRAAGDGSGGVATAGGSSGGSGGDKGVNNGETAAQAGGALQTPGYSGTAGQAGGESGRSVRSQDGAVVQANAGGGGGASVGSGGSGESVARNAAAGRGELGGGGGGGRGGINTADSGARGGHGFIRLTMSEPAAQVPAPAPVVVVMAPQRYSLSTDALFGFGKSALQPAGEAKLDSIVAKLGDSRVGRITVTGHADRLGSSEINQQLSVNRAESVKTYLVSKNIQSERIAVVGKGETEPVTQSTDCKGPVSAKVIACLAADRRVDIEMVGTEK